MAREATKWCIGLFVINSLVKLRLDIAKLALSRLTSRWSGPAIAPENVRGLARQCFCKRLDRSLSRRPLSSAVRHQTPAALIERFISRGFRG